MFNVCPGCGEYSEGKEVKLGSPSVAICGDCDFEQPFLALPLYVVTGASGSGKTTAALKLSSSNSGANTPSRDIPQSDFVVLDQDILWNEAMNAPANGFRLFRNTWLRMAKNIHQAGRSVVLFGSALPEQYESCPERRYFSSVHYLTLVCTAEELERRLTSRPGWRNSGTPAVLQQMQEFNSWLRKNAGETNPRMSVLDTTNASVEETVEQIKLWLADPQMFLPSELTEELVD